MWFGFIGGFDARMAYHFQSGETRTDEQYIKLFFTENYFDCEIRYRYEFIPKELDETRKRRTIGIHYNENIERIPKIYPPSPCIVQILSFDVPLLRSCFTVYLLFIIFVYSCVRARAC